MKTLDLEVLSSFPRINESRIDKLLQNELLKNPCKLIILYDDPTGVQTVHNISVYTDW